MKDFIEKAQGQIGASCRRREWTGTREYSDCNEYEKHLLYYNATTETTAKETRNSSTLKKTVLPSKPESVSWGISPKSSTNPCSQAP